jgi:hypothetical protein
MTGMEIKKKTVFRGTVFYKRTLLSSLTKDHSEMSLKLYPDPWVTQS